MANPQHPTTYRGRMIYNEMRDGCWRHDDKKNTPLSIPKLESLLGIENIPQSEMDLLVEDGFLLRWGTLGGFCDVAYDPDEHYVVHPDRLIQVGPTPKWGHDLDV